MTKQSRVDSFYIQMIFEIDDIIQKIEVLSNNEYILKPQTSSIKLQNTQKQALQSDFTEKQVAKQELFDELQQKINEIQNFMNENMLSRIEIELLIFLEKNLYKLLDRVGSNFNLNQLETCNIPPPDFIPRQQEEFEQQTEKQQKLGQRCMFLLGEKIKQTENQMFEFKNFTFPVKGSKQQDIITSVICSFLNSKGGYLIFGIDDRTLQVVGMNLKLHERDVFKLQLIGLALSIYPTPDLREQHEVAVTFIPIKNKMNIIIPGLFIVQVTVQQGRYLEKLYTYKSLDQNQILAQYRLDGRKEQLMHPQLIDEIYIRIAKPRIQQPNIQGVDQDSIKDIEDIIEVQGEMQGLFSSIKVFKDEQKASAQGFTIYVNLKQFVSEAQINQFQLKLIEMLGIRKQQTKNKTNTIIIYCDGSEMFNIVKGNILRNQKKLSKNYIILSIYANKENLIDNTGQQKLSQNNIQPEVQDAQKKQKKQQQQKSDEILNQVDFSKIQQFATQNQQIGKGQQQHQVNQQDKNLQHNIQANISNQEVKQKKKKNNQKSSKILDDLNAKGENTDKFPEVKQQQQNSNQAEKQLLNQKNKQKQRQASEPLNFQLVNDDQPDLNSVSKKKKAKKNKKDKKWDKFYLIITGFNIDKKVELLNKLDLTSKPDLYQLNPLNSNYTHTILMSFSSLEVRNNYIDLVAQTSEEFQIFSLKNQLTFFYCQESPTLIFSKLSNIHIEILQGKDFQMEFQNGGFDGIVFKKLPDFIQAYDILIEQFLQDRVCFTADWNKEFSIEI